MITFDDHIKCKKVLTVFPTKSLKFDLIDSQSETLDRLKRRTEYSENLTSSYTQKSFRGQIENNEFKIISSAIGRGAFCVMEGMISERSGEVRIRVNKAFKILIAILYLLPLVGIVITWLFNPEQFTAFLIPIMLLQLLFIRFVFVGMAFYFFSRHSENRLRDVLDIEWVK